MKDLTSLSLDELIENLKVHKMIIKKDSEIGKAKEERKCLALKDKKESSDEECLTSGSKDEEYAMAVRDFKKFFKRRECTKPPKDKNQRAFIGGSWSDSGKEDDEKAKDKTYFVAQASNEICLGVDLEPDEWIKDSRCSKHMTGNRKLFSIYKAYNGVVASMIPHDHPHKQAKDLAILIYQYYIYEDLSQQAKRLVIFINNIMFSDLDVLN
ncbi:hypothetical protein Tco_0627291 [Tanacetum coccineum]|uniref:Uncharacterized protein n=1 Tax=Tanacetum coccineum TaxID=301880 RepID=A0ABQ4WM18_9ASTR